MASVGRHSKFDQKKVRKICNRVKDMAAARMTSTDAPKVTWDNLLIEVNKSICADNLVKDKKSLMRNEQIKSAYDEAILMQREHRGSTSKGSVELLARDQLLSLVAEQEVEIKQLRKRLAQMADMSYTKLLALATSPVTMAQAKDIKKDD